MSSSYRAENKLHLSYNKNENYVFSEVVHGLHQGLLRRYRKFREATISFVISVSLYLYLSEWKNATPTGQIFMKFDYWDF
jgi:hypothetical protein